MHSNYLYLQEKGEHRMNMWKALRLTWIRHRKAERLRKQMNMTRKCSKELDTLLYLIGIDFASLELCPVQVERRKLKNGEP